MSANFSKSVPPSLNTVADTAAQKPNGLREKSWKRDGDVSVVSGQWRVTKYKVMDAWKYMLFLNDVRLSLHGSFEEAKRAIDEVESSRIRAA